MEPDLYVTLGSGCSSQRLTGFSQILGRDSGYVRAKLVATGSSVDLTEPLHVQFPDVSRTTWDRAMYFLLPQNAFSLCLTDVEDLYPFFQKYEFDGGKELCDKFILQTLMSPRRSTFGINEKVASLLCIRFAMPESFEAAKSELKVALDPWSKTTGQQNGFILSAEEIRWILSSLSLEKEEMHLVKRMAGRVKATRLGLDPDQFLTELVECLDDAEALKIIQSGQFAEQYCILLSKYWDRR